MIEDAYKSASNYAPPALKLANSYGPPEPITMAPASYYAPQWDTYGATQQYPGQNACLDYGGWLLIENSYEAPASQSTYQIVLQDYSTAVNDEYNVPAAEEPTVTYDLPAA